jgi:hypothetical protein
MRIRLALLGLIAVAAATVFASSASAHTLSETRASNAAQATANDLVKREEYTSASVTECRKQFPHRVRCFVRFKEGTRTTCKDTWMMYYKSHGDAGQSRRVWYYSEKKHAC